MTKQEAEITIKLPIEEYRRAVNLAKRLGMLSVEQFALYSVNNIIKAVEEVPE